MLSRSILQYVWPALSDNRSWKTIFGLLFEWPLKTVFTVPLSSRLGSNIRHASFCQNQRMVWETFINPKQTMHQTSCAIIFKNFEHFFLFLFSNKMLVSRTGIHKQIAIMASIADPDQTATSEAVWSGLALFCRH